MNPEAYEEMASVESGHWWFRARRQIIDQVITTMALPHPARILEVGSGTGGNLVMLSRHGNVCAIEMDENARKISIEKTQGQFSVRAGHCPDNLPLSGESFDLICMFDVLEHIDEDVATLAALSKNLARGGRMLVTVPAYPWLWSTHDAYLHHKRRYTAKTLMQAFRQSGLHLERLSYFNMFLLPAIAAARLKDRILSNGKPSGTSSPPGIINKILYAIFASERGLLARFNLPAGVSLMGIVRSKP